MTTIVISQIGSLVIDWVDCFKGEIFEEKLTSSSFHRILTNSKSGMVTTGITYLAIVPSSST